MKQFFAGLMVVILVIGAVFAADEITMSSLLKVKNGQFELQRNVASRQFDQTGRTASYIIQSFPTALTRVSIASEISTNGFYWMNNLSTNPAAYIDIGVTNGAAFLPLIRLKGGEFSSGRLYPTNAIWAMASEGLSLEMWVNQD